MADVKDEQASGGASATNGLGISSDSTTTRHTTQSDTDPGNKFQQAVAAWRTLDLTTLVSSLDIAASELVTQQRDSLLQRKDLAQKTKDFRKLEDTAKLTEIKDLLKAYQGYIDVITTQSKNVSSAFMQAYTPLSDAPDPYPLLDASIDSLVTAEEVVPRLREENEQLHRQGRKLNTQIEDLEKQLEEERTNRQSFEGSQDSRIKEVEESWTAVLKEKEDNWAAKESSLEEKVGNQDRLLKELKASYEVSQRLEQSGDDAQDTGRNAASAAELEVANSELERTSTRLAEIESRNEQLRLELAQSASSSSARSTAVEDDPAYLRLRSENSSLLRRLDNAKYAKDSSKSSLEIRLRGLEKDLSTLRSDRDALQTRVQKWSDYDDLKREVEMLRSIEFATTEDDADIPATNGTSASDTSLEHLLLTRNKKLTSDLTDLRISHTSLQQTLASLQETLSKTSTDLEKARSLNATLENDLQKTQQEASNAWETMSVAGTYTSRYPKSGYSSRRGIGGGGGGGGGPSPTSSIIGGFDPSASGTGSPRGLDALRAGEPVGGGAGILPMVTSQRDRFAKKIGELEAELGKQYATVSSLRSEVGSLQRDNLGLYEKTRYVSTYNRSGTTGTAYPNPTSGSDGGGSGGLGRYREVYESNISPFAAFRGRESARAVKRMTLPERAVFQVTRLVLQTRTSRNLFALYCVGLHLLVLGMLFSMGTGVEGGTTAAVDQGNWRSEEFEGGGGGG